jgi:hypothetical protein
MLLAIYKAKEHTGPGLGSVLGEFCSRMENTYVPYSDSCDRPDISTCWRAGR